jgi:hypothetical protein
MVLAWSPWACLRTAVGCTRPGTPLLYAQARATAHAFAWRGSYTARSCANEKAVANQRMPTCRSQWNGNPTHIQRGSGPAPPLRPPASRPPPSWPAKPRRAAELQSPAGANRPQTHAQSHGGGPTQRAHVRMKRLLPIKVCRRVARSATETQHIQSGGGPAPPLRPPSCWPPPSWPAQPERTAELQSPARANPHPDLGGPKRSKNVSSR